MTPTRISRLAIVNRGEAAMRLIHAARELGDQQSDAIRLIALYTESERDAMFVRNADEAFCIGPSIIVDPSGARRNAYLDHGALEGALRKSRADAAWVGWGFVAEQPEFAELCERLGITFIGPEAPVMRLVGDEIAAKQLAEQAGVPVAPWSGGPVEKLITSARHVEVQIIADGQGGVWPLGVRDCSYQRRNQKVLEESASPALTAEQERELMAAAARLVLRAGYRNAGTVRFLYEPAEQRFSFMEVNASLQVEHGVTEVVTGLDLVKLQLQVAAGGRLEGDPPDPIGHAIEARLNAEDPALGFAPAPGRLAMLRLPTGPGLRVDTGVAEGDVIPDAFDSMIATVIAWGRDRGEALARLRRALADTIVVVEGGTTNQGFLLELLDRPEVRSGDVDTAWLDRLYGGGSVMPVRHGEIALLQAAVELADRDLAVDRAHFYALARRGRPHASSQLQSVYDLRHHGQSYRLVVSQIAPDGYRITCDGQEIEVLVRRHGAYERRLELRGESYRTVTSSQGDDLLVEVDGVPHRVSRDDRGLVRNLSPAVVVSIPVEVGDTVEEGDVLAVVEAMKMESSLTAPFRGRVREIFVGETVHVAAQAPLVALEQLSTEPARSYGPRLQFAQHATPAPSTPAPQRCHVNLERMRWLVLGYDIGAPEVERVITDLRGDCADTLACGPELIPGEHRLLSMFANLRAISRPALREHDPEEDLLQSPQENLHAWLRSLDAEAEGLPEWFLIDLRRALAHYGIADLERTGALEDGCYRLFLSQQRAQTARAVILAILDRRLEQAAQLAGAVGDDFRVALDHLIVVLEGRDPVVADLAREVRFRYFDQPVITAATDRVYAEMGQHIAALANDPKRPDRDEVISAIVHCPRPLATLLTGSMRASAPDTRASLVEAMVRRYNRMHSLSGFEQMMLESHPALLGRCEFEGHERRLVAAYVELGELCEVAAAFTRYAATLPGGESAVLDLYADHGENAPSHEELAARLTEAFAGIPGLPAPGRIVVAVAEPRRGRGMSAVDLFTFRPGSDGLVEDQVLRGLHPMMGHRLQLWRLCEFDLERLPSSEDIYLFKGTARANPEDERLFALAEVRDLTPVLDERGRHVALPELEQVLIRVLETIRGFQAKRPLNRRLMWNRVLLHVWPVMRPHPDEIRAIVERFAPAAAGLGLEMLNIQGRVAESDGQVRERLLRFFGPTGHDVALEIDDPPTTPLQTLDEGARRLISARRRGTLHPAEIVRLIAPARASGGQPAGIFVEHELDDDGQLVPVERPAATNPSGIVVGTIVNYTERYPEGIKRVILLGDPTRSLGALAEPECRRIMAAIDLAEELGLPLEWFALSAGAKIAMDSGTETMDWISAVLRRIVLFTQAGGEINVVVAGINVGAQPYWNAEATMLMRSRGALIMTPDSAMVLTGKQSLDYAGGVSAEDNFGIGGYERIMGPNGQAQYWAADLAGACRVLLAYYEHAYVAPGERFPRQAVTSDPAGRDVGLAAHSGPGTTIERVGQVFSDEFNPGRKRPFDIRSVMRAVIDADHAPLERWGRMHQAEIAVVWDAHLGGWPLSLIGIESRPLARHGPIPADGPENWTSGTLFPRSAKKIARAINSTAGRRPLVVLANLAGFDGSPESMRECQLEFGSEIGCAIVNFDGPIVFCVISRYHGGSFVVFSQKLNPNIETVALQGARASVIGGAPAAAVVFAREVEQAARADERVDAIERQIAEADGTERQRLRTERAILWEDVVAQHRREFADRFDATHSIERAVRVGSVSSIVAPASLRAFLIGAIERGMRKVLASGATETSNGRDRAPVADTASG